MKKTYSSLTQLKVEIEREGKCEVLEFNGMHLIVQCDNKKIRYGLNRGEVIETILLEKN